MPFSVKISNSNECGNTAPSLDALRGEYIVPIHPYLDRNWQYKSLNRNVK